MGETMSGQLVQDPVLKQRLTFERTVEDGRETLLVETWVDPGGGVTPHIHPAMEERFEVLDGEVSFLSGRKWVTARAGESVTVPAGVRHAYRNKSGAEAHMVCHATPPSTLQEFLEDAASLSRAGLITGKGLPKGPGALLRAAVMVEAYRDMAVLLFPPLPPPAVQRLVMPLLAKLGRRRGYAPGRLTA
jgi:quercetin dioxygenase-like cupin family protein